jgi:hypothetical protein
VARRHEEGEAVRLTGASVQANTFPTDDISLRFIQSRAVEAVIWGMPAVNYDFMRQEMFRTTECKENEILYWSQPLDWRNQTLTPNPDSIYFMCFYNTEDGPIVIEIPPAEGGSLAGNIVDIWQMPLEDAGPEGADQGKGGKYLILPPNDTDTPRDGYIVLQSGTYGGYALLRSNLRSHEDVDVANAVAYGKRVKVYRLSKAGSPPPTKFIDAAEILFDSTIRYDVSFFEHLDRIVQNEPWLERDRAMIDPLKSIGIEKGKPFSPDVAAQATLAAAAYEARVLLAHKYDGGLPPYWPESRWGSPAYPDMVKAMQGGYRDLNAYPVDERGVTYSFAFIGIKRLGTAQFYLMAIKDKDGEDLDGGRVYRLTVPAKAPVSQYWSATAYDRETHALIRNMSRASRSSQIADLKKNGDGSTDIYFCPTAPAGRETNWVPTDPKRPFEVLFRLYGPQKPLFEKTWQLADIEEVKS